MQVYRVATEMTAAPQEVESKPLSARSTQAIAHAIPSPRLMMLVSAAYFAAAVFAIYLSGQAGNIASLWLANAIMLAALFRQKIETWPSLLLLQEFACASANVVMGSGPAAAIGVAAADVLEVLLVAAAVYRFGSSWPSLTSFRWLALFAAASIAASAVAALFGTGWLYLLGQAPFGPTFKLWLVADSLGLLIVTPLLLAWTDRTLRSETSTTELVEVFLLTALVAVVAIFVFIAETMPFMSVVFPFLVLATFRGGLLGATAALVALAVVAMGFTLNGHGPFAVLPKDPGMTEHVQIMQVYLLVAGLMTLPVAIVLRQRAALTKKLGYMAKHDLLTDLPNRFSLEEGLQHSIRRVGRGDSFAIHYIDLDRFKDVNETFGHPCGDALLKQIADRLRDGIRRDSMVARVGGDEFVIIQPGVGCEGEAAALAARTVELIEQPCEFEGKKFFLSGSIGIARAPADSTDADELLRKADLALRHAKSSGRDKFLFFEQNIHDELQAQIALEADLKRAPDNDEFHLVYQPILDLQTDTISGFEALIRWNHPVRGVISPKEFIPLAEKSGLITCIGEWTLKQACVEAAGWPSELKVAVNLSAVQLKDLSIVARVARAVQAAGLAPGRLELEVTETVLLEEMNLAVLHQLRATGARIVMDDFGTGYSSLTYLRNFPFDKIKIDHSFVHEMLVKENTAAIVRATIQLAQTLGITTTGEGVETAEQLEFLRSEGCHEAQGYHISPPKPSKDSLDLVAQFRRSSMPRARAKALKVV